MSSNNPCNAKDAISSLEDSESTMSLHDARKHSNTISKNEEQKIIPSSYPNSFNNDITLHPPPHRPYNASPHQGLFNNTNMVTYHNPMNFNPNSMQQMQFQQNYCQPNYLHPVPGIPMHHIHVVNQPNPSQSMTSPFSPFPPFPNYHPGATINPLPYAVNSPSFSPSLNHSIPPPPPPSEQMKKKRKKKPNERRIQKFRDKAAFHQKALALGMALLNQIEDSGSKEASTKESSTTIDDNVSTKCVGNVKKNSLTESGKEISNVSFDINHTGIGSITNINITKKKTCVDDNKSQRDISVPVNISVSNSSPKKKLTDCRLDRTQSDTRSSNSTRGTGVQLSTKSDITQKSTESSKENMKADSTQTIDCSNPESTRSKRDSLTLSNSNSIRQTESQSTTSKKKPENEATSSKKTTSAKPSVDATMVSQRDRHGKSNLYENNNCVSKRKRMSDNYSTDNYKPYYNEKDRNRYNDHRTATYPKRSSSYKNHQCADNRSSSSSHKTLPSYNSSYDKNALYGNTIPRKSKEKLHSSQSNHPPTHVIVQKDKPKYKYAHHSVGQKKNSSGWSEKKKTSTGWGNSSCSSVNSSRRNDSDYNPLESRKTFSYGGWLPIYYKGPPVTTIEKKTKSPKKDKKTKERNRKQRLELVKMLKDSFSKRLLSHKIVKNESSFKRLESKWKIEFLQQFPHEMTNLRLFWTTSFTNHFVGIKIYSMLGEAHLEIIGHITSFIIGIHALSLKTSSKKGTNDVTFAIPMNILNMYQTNLLDMEFSDYRFLCGIMRQNQKKRAESNRSGFLLNSNQIAGFCFGVKGGDCVKKFKYGSEAKYFYRKKRALLRTLHELDKNNELQQNKKVQEDNQFAPLSYDSDGNLIIEEYMFEGSEEDAQLTAEREDKAIRETLVSLLFTAFEHSLKCPFSKVYNEVPSLCPCYFPDEECKNGRHGTLEHLLQHVDSKNCKYHHVLGDYIRYFIEDKNDECIRILIENRATSIK